MSADTSIADWITAVATAATAMGGAVASIYGLYRATKSKLPTVEATVRWSKEYGHFLVLSVTVRNRIHETLVCDSVRIETPHTMRIAEAVWESPYGGMSGLKRTDQRASDLGYTVASLGTPSSQNRISPGDTDFWDIYLSPQNDWASGKITVSFRFSSKADTIRSKRITITRQVPVADSKTKDEIAKSQA